MELSPPRRRRAQGCVLGGVRFLLAGQDADGLWRDFTTPAGEASFWPTAVIGEALLGAAPGATAVDRAALDRAARALVAGQQADGGWGYNPSVPADADSTAWALLFLARLGGHEAPCRRAVSHLARHQRPSGGVATYAEARAIRRYMGLRPWVPFRGWCRPHTEVTAVAGRALLALGDPDATGPAAAAAWRYLRSEQHTDGHWTSYWWTSAHYATAQGALLASALGHREAAAAAAAWVRRHPPGSAFDCALALLTAGAGGSDPGLVDALVDRLASAQQPDGGWPSGPSLRIPVPPEVDPAGERPRRLVRFAGGIEVADQHRLFTTAACVAALAGAG